MTQTVAMTQVGLCPIGARKLDLIKEIHAYLDDEINQMNELMLSALNVEEELVTIIGNHLASSGGKRIRPILTMLTAKMLGYKGHSHICLAASVEFIHLATLLHDDVVDGSKMRRFLPTANVLWGSKASILVGDFLFSQSFKHIVSSKSLRALEVLSSSSAIIAEGEVSQLAKLEEHRIISESEYIKIISAKTAELFAAAAEVGAIIAGSDDSDCEAARAFGMQLGLIFQITDDLLDYLSDAGDVGKNIGDDFEEGKVTLPIIYLYEKAQEKERDEIIAMIKSRARSSSDFDVVRAMLQKYDIRSTIHESLAGIKFEAEGHLDKISITNQSKEYLRELINFAISRSY